MSMNFLNQKFLATLILISIIYFLLFLITDSGRAFLLIVPIGIGFLLEHKNFRWGNIGWQVIFIALSFSIYVIFMGDFLFSKISMLENENSRNSIMFFSVLRMILIFVLPLAALSSPLYLEFLLEKMKTYSGNYWSEVNIRFFCLVTVNMAYVFWDQRVEGYILYGLPWVIIVATIQTFGVALMFRNRFKLKI